MMGRRLPVLLCAALLAGCASHPPVSPEQALRERAQTYWQALQLNDWQTAYAMESNAQPRGDLTAVAYAQQRNMASQVVASQVKQVEVDGRRGTVTMQWTLRLPLRGGPTVTRDGETSWVLIKGEWCHEAKPQRPIQEMLQQGLSLPPGKQPPVPETAAPEPSPPGGEPQ